MPNRLRNLLAVVLGLAIGAGANGALVTLVTLGPMLIPPPAGADMLTAEGLSKAMPLLEPRHFLMPFLAHALGTLMGAIAAFLIAATHKARFAYAIGLAFLCDGVAAALMIPAPAWFIAADLLLAYVPMAWLAVRFARRSASG